MNCNKKFIIYNLLFIIIFSSCEVINPEEAIPSFLEVNNFELITTLESQGSNQHQINDVWAFIDGEALGIFELPATIPILAEGPKMITLIAGIRENGLRNAPVIYPFYDGYVQDLTLIEGQTITVNPTINYSSNSVFEFLENFESSNLKLAGQIQQTTDNNKVKEGRGSGSILLDQSSIELNSSVTFIDLPTVGGLPVFLEMDYRTNVELEIGLVGFDINSINSTRSINYKVTLCPISEWNKVYINFQEDLELSQFTGYQLAFRASTDNTGCDNISRDNPEILLDNIKLIRFQP